ncbi:MAG: alpha/beta hydrolase [Prosthecobacter sp.]
MNFPDLAIRTSIFLALTVFAANAGEVEHHNDIMFAKPGGVELLLNLHMPKGVENPPLVMFIHGGGWTNGDRSRCRLDWVAEHGYAVASIEYRLSQEALFPAQIHDCKGALRWLRAHQGEYGYDSSKVVVAGTSAGGHLSALMGTSGGVAALEGETAGHPEQSSSVQGVIDYYGPSDFVKRSENQPSKTDDPKGSVFKLIGGPVKANLKAARAASPITYLSSDDPPFLILHGDKDKTVYLDQSELLLQRCKDLGIDAQLHIEKDAGHGFKEMSAQEKQLVLAFLEKMLPKKQ